MFVYGCLCFIQMYLYFIYLAFIGKFLHVEDVYKYIWLCMLMHGCLCIACSYTYLCLLLLYSYNWLYTWLPAFLHFISIYYPKTIRDLRGKHTCYIYIVAFYSSPIFFVLLVEVVTLHFELTARRSLLDSTPQDPIARILCASRALQNTLHVVLAFSCHGFIFGPMSVFTHATDDAYCSFWWSYTQLELSK